MNKKNLKFIKLSYQHIPELMNLEKIIFPCPWSEDMFYNEIGSEFSNFYVLTDEENKIVGYFGLWIIADEGHINNFAVIPEFRGCGIGKMMMEKIFEIGAKHKVSLYYLEVRISNEPAIRLYKKFGFFEAGIRKNYYSQPVEDALLMTKVVL